MDADQTIYDRILSGSNGSIGATALQLTSTAFKTIRGVQIKAAYDNTGIVYVGKQGVTADSAEATDGFQLLAGEGVFIPIDDISKVYVIASATDQKVFYLAV